MALSLLGAVVLARSVKAHDSPEHVVENLTRLIKEQGESVSLLLRRAVEHRALRNYDLAIKDLHRALQLDEKAVPVLSELAQVHLARRDYPAALKAADRALAHADAGGVAPLHIVKAEIHLASGRPTNAVAECALAFSNGMPQIEWYLLRSTAQAAAQDHAGRLKGLVQGLETTGSGVLKAEWIEALIDAGQATQALKEIDAELEESRWQSSWLIRRARARLTLGQVESAQADLATAVAELNQRLRPERPDLTLLADRGLAFALLKDRRAAQKDLDAAVKAGADTWMLRQLRASLASDARADPR